MNGLLLRARPSAKLCRTTPWEALRACLVGAVFFAGCSVVEGSGVIETEERPVAEASSVDVCCGFSVRVEQGDEPRLRLTADDNLLPEVEVVEQGGRLSIGWRSDSELYEPTRAVEVDLVLPEVRKFETSGGGTIEFGPMTAPSLDVVTSGGAAAHFREVETEAFRGEFSGAASVSFHGLVTQTLSLDSSGGGIVRADGVAEQVDVTVSGGGSYRAWELPSADVVLNLTGGSVARVAAHSLLEVAASGGSEVRYQGEPVLRVNLTGGSTVEPRSSDDRSR